VTKLPPSALEVLAEASGDLNRKHVAAAMTRSLGAREVRRALRNTARAAAPGQVPRALYDLDHTDRSRL